MIPPTRADDDDARASSPAGCAAPSQRLADLRAQRAANRIGARRLAELAERHGRERLRAGMAEILDYAERRTRAALAELPDGAYEAEDVLEDDAGGDARRRAAGRGDDRRRRAARSTSPAPTPRSRATSTARSR